ncbi:MAG: hypothetical protein LBQ00_02340 [Syntrophobacterales bacterium]|jgi:hypothetical protein|nr:hypothetical protein [Syntrophobacterales bacterium]
MEERNATMESLRQKLFEEIMNSIKNMKLNGDPARRLPNTLNLSFYGVEGEPLAIVALDLNGIAVSSDSARYRALLCSRGHGNTLQGRCPLELGQRQQRGRYGICNFGLSRSCKQIDRDVFLLQAGLPLRHL